MQLGKTGWALAAAALAVVGASLGAAYAQGGPPAGAPEVPVERDVNLSPQQRLARANTSLAEMRRGAATVRRMLSEARQARDVVKVLCLNDKLNQIDVAIRSARDRVKSLKAAVDSGDADRSRHEFTIVQVLRDRVRSLVAEANQCIGEETGFVGESAVTVEVDPNIPDTEEGQFPDDPLFSEPPRISSPTQ